MTTKGQQFFSANIYINRTGDKIVVSGSSDGTAAFYVDDLLKLTVTHPDGSVLSTTIDDSNGCTASSVLTTPATNVARYLQYGVNKVHVTYSDACGGDYGNSDIWITGTANFPAPANTLPAIDGGTRIGVFYTNPKFANRRTGAAPGVACTTAFGVSAFGATDYELTAKHCFDQEQGNQSTNQYIPSNMPLDVKTVDSLYTFAQELSCLIGSVGCLLPADHARPSGDVVAFRPDTATPTARVQTGSGLLPVIGETTLGALPKGTRICHYGNGSLGTYGNAEQCGTSLGLSTGSYRGQPVPAGLGIISARGAGGDSGGPVYAYSYGSGKNPVGVYALGLTVEAPPNDGTPTVFYPIADIESNLGVRLLTAPALQ